MASWNRTFGQSPKSKTKSPVLALKTADPQRVANAARLSAVEKPVEVRPATWIPVERLRVGDKNFGSKGCAVRKLQERLIFKIAAKKGDNEIAIGLEDMATFLLDVEPACLVVLTNTSSVECSTSLPNQFFNPNSGAPVLKRSIAVEGPVRPLFEQLVPWSKRNEVLRFSTAKEKELFWKGEHAVFVAPMGLANASTTNNPLTKKALSEPPATPVPPVATKKPAQPKGKKAAAITISASPVALTPPSPRGSQESNGRPPALDSPLFNPPRVGWHKMSQESISFDGITIRQEDVDRCKPDEFLNDNIIDLYLALLRQRIKDETILICNTHAFKMMQSKPAECAQRWFRKKSSSQEIFQKRVVILPANDDGKTHWELIVVLNLPSVLTEQAPKAKKRKLVPAQRSALDTPARSFEKENAWFTPRRDSQDSSSSPGEPRENKPVILVLDSMGPGDKRCGNVVKEFLKQRLPVEMPQHCPDALRRIADMPILLMKVPQQRNFSDCGVFMLHYVDLLCVRQFLDQLLRYPENQLNQSKWFPESDVNDKRVFIADIVFEMDRHMKQHAKSKMKPKFPDRIFRVQPCVASYEQKLELVEKELAEVRERKEKMVAQEEAMATDSPQLCDVSEPASQDFAVVIPHTETAPTESRKRKRDTEPAFAAPKRVTRSNQKAPDVVAAASSDSDSESESSSGSDLDTPTQRINSFSS